MCVLSAASRPLGRYGVPLTIQPLDTNLEGPLSLGLAGFGGV